MLDCNYDERKSPVNTFDKGFLRTRNPSEDVFPHKTSQTFFARSSSNRSRQGRRTKMNKSMNLTKKDLDDPLFNKNIFDISFEDSVTRSPIKKA